MLVLCQGIKMQPVFGKMQFSSKQCIYLNLYMLYRIRFL